jgi:hypothetical protein
MELVEGLESLRTPFSVLFTSKAVVKRRDTRVKGWRLSDVPENFRVVPRAKCLFVCFL